MKGIDHIIKWSKKASIEYKLVYILVSCFVRTYSQIGTNCSIIIPKEEKSFGSRNIGTPNISKL